LSIASVKFFLADSMDVANVSELYPVAEAEAGLSADLRRSTLRSAAPNVSSLNIKGARYVPFRTNMRITSAERVDKNSLMETILPNDLDIFSPPSCNMPL